jgi:hypothetical protein
MQEEGWSLEHSGIALGSCAHVCVYRAVPSVLIAASLADGTEGRKPQSRAWSQTGALVAVALVRAEFMQQGSG